MAERTCAHCGEAFHTDHPRQRYCDERCRQNAATRRSRIKAARPCEWCGKTMHPHPHRNQRGCTVKCGKALEHEGSYCDVTYRDCRTCGAAMIARGRRVYCSPVCRPQRVTPGTEVTATCHVCNATFTYVRITSPRTVCSKRCAHVHYRRSDRALALAATRVKRRRARKLTTESEEFDPKDVFARDAWRCGLCGGKTRQDRAHPDPQAPVIDHVLPLSRGGTHTLGNVQCAHSRCNAVKGNRPWDGAEQLRLTA